MNVSDIKAQTALFVAVKNKHLNCVKLLLKVNYKILLYFEQISAVKAVVYGKLLNRRFQESVIHLSSTFTKTNLGENSTENGQVHSVAVADPGFPRRGAPTTKVGVPTYYLVKYFLQNA